MKKKLYFGFFFYYGVKMTVPTFANLISSATPSVGWKIKRFVSIK
jgi:hypothetical protein